MTNNQEQKERCAYCAHETKVGLVESPWRKDPAGDYYWVCYVCYEAELGVPKVTQAKLEAAYNNEGGNE